MSDLDATTPRVFLVRHGETEWTKNGRYTGATELDLTPNGVKQVTDTAIQLVGPQKLIDPARILHAWISPRKRTQQTFQHFFGARIPSSDLTIDADKITLSEDLTEWDYGDYEGMRVEEITASRKQRGLDQKNAWNIWQHGCEGGESAEQVTERLDRLIGQISNIQRPYMNGEKPADVVLVAHGLILRAFVKRWLKYPLDAPLTMMLSPGAVGILSYRNHNVDDRGLFIGTALPPME
ncbi:phosphoglycerate mutase [Penicillium nucicola]|uniref:phosphoglycerate mutase n=1 Tax=Penicillium nucicola TaxID=1850975 RepID=UPI00254593CB|nr:phosphoglycerate mutase [Penicillium nucicola]KAJ5776447.1 phosphoglycerate mutase [Penicillium nucicola]